MDEHVVRWVSAGPLHAFTRPGHERRGGLSREPNPSPALSPSMSSADAATACALRLAHGLAAGGDGPSYLGGRERAWNHSRYRVRRAA